MFPMLLGPTPHSRNVIAAPMELCKICGHCAEGAYAVVFFKDGKAVKVFKRRLGDPQQHVTDVFNSEVAAYARAAETVSLKELVSHFEGRVTVKKIVDAKGNDISNDFDLRCAYAMRQLPGIAKKIGTIPSDIADPIRQCFQAAGINHTQDCSVFFGADGKVSNVIDFALQEFELEHLPL